jgi:hypothetical protein
MRLPILGHGSVTLASVILLAGPATVDLRAAEPAVFWASDPVRPGEAVVVIGDGFGEQPTVELARVPDGGQNPVPASELKPVEVLQPNDTSLKFVVPADWKPGVYVYRIVGSSGRVSGLLNRPRVLWVQGNQGPGASPGGWLRVFGRNLAAEPPAANPATSVRLAGPKSVTLTAQGDGFAIRTELPSDLPAGEYQLSVHNGWGGDLAWSEAVTVAVATPAAWPQTILNVKDFGADGNGSKDDTAAVLAALERADTAGGGIVFFPRGRYRLSESLKVPRFTVLRGEKCDWVSLAWIDFSDPPEALVQGSNHFGLEDLTLYAFNHRHVIAADLGGQPDAGDVFLRRVRVRAVAYRDHLPPEKIDERFRASLRLSTGGGDTVRLGGPNIEIADCDLYGSGRALFLSRVRGGRVTGNTFHNGRWGWYCLSGNDGLIFDNRLTGGDLMSTGGGLNCLDGSTSSQNVYYAHNELSLMHGWDREAMTTDAGGEAYFGKLSAAQGSTLTLAGEPQWRKRSWAGAGAFILAGKGAGQYRRVVSHDGPTVQVDRPWAVPPDTDSEIGITMFQGGYLVIDNQFTDTGAVQLYGTSIECVLAQNRGTRMQGFRGLGLWYHGYQPSWFCQFLDNQILEGT